MERLLVEELVGDALGQVEDLASVLGVGVVPEVGALVDEPLSLRGHDEAEGVGVLLVEVGDSRVAEGRRVEVPGDGVAAAPVAEWLRADVERHLDALAGVEPHAADLGELPPRAEVARAHLRVGLEAAAGEHDRLGAQLLVPAGRLDDDARDTRGVVGREADGGGVVAHLDAPLLRDREELVREPLAGADGFKAETAPEAVDVAVLERLVRPGRHEPDALVVEPAHRRERAAHERVRHLLVGQALRHAHQVVEVRALRVAAHFEDSELRLREVGHDLADVVDTFVGEADGAAGEVGVAAAQVLGRLLDHDHGPPTLACGERGAEGCVPGAYDDDVGGLGHGVPPPWTDGRLAPVSRAGLGALAAR